MKLLLLLLLSFGIIVDLSSGFFVRRKNCGNVEGGKRVNVSSIRTDVCKYISGELAIFECHLPDRTIPANKDVLQIIEGKKYITRCTADGLNGVDIITRAVEETKEEPKIDCSHWLNKFYRPCLSWGLLNPFGPNGFPDSVEKRTTKTTPVPAKPQTQPLINNDSKIDCKNIMNMYYKPCLSWGLPNPFGPNGWTNPKSKTTPEPVKPQPQIEAINESKINCKNFVNALYQPCLSWGSPNPYVAIYGPSGFPDSFEKDTIKTTPVPAKPKPQPIINNDSKIDCKNIMNMYYQPCLSWGMPNPYGPNGWTSDKTKTTPKPVKAQPQIETINKSKIDCKNIVNAMYKPCLSWGSPNPYVAIYGPSGFPDSFEKDTAKTTPERAKPQPQPETANESKIDCKNIFNMFYRPCNPEGVPNPYGPSGFSAFFGEGAKKTIPVPVKIQPQPLINNNSKIDCKNVMNMYYQPCLSWGLPNPYGPNGWTSHKTKTTPKPVKPQPQIEAINESKIDCKNIVNAMYQPCLSWGMPNPYGPNGFSDLFKKDTTKSTPVPAKPHPQPERANKSNINCSNVINSMYEPCTPGGLTNPYVWIYGPGGYPDYLLGNRIV